MTLPHKPFYFIRHGETDWNFRKIYMGANDIPLNSTGIEQAQSAALHLKNEPIEYIVSSPLSRALKTAEIIGSELNKPITIIDSLKECSLGSMEGQAHGNLIDEWLQGKTITGAEDLKNFEDRVANGFKQALEFSGTVLIVAHGGVYSAAQRVFDWPAVQLQNCAALHLQPPGHPSHLWSISEL